MPGHVLVSSQHNTYVIRTLRFTRTFAYVRNENLWMNLVMKSILMSFIFSTKYIDHMFVLFTLYFFLNRSIGIVGIVLPYGSNHRNKYNYANINVWYLTCHGKFESKSNILNNNNPCSIYLWTMKKTSACKLSYVINLALMAVYKYPINWL